MAGNTGTDEARRLDHPLRADSAGAPKTEEPASEVTSPGVEDDSGDDDDESYPEGGVRAWLTIVGSFLVYFGSFGIINSFGFFQTYYEDGFLEGYSSTAISFIGTLQITLMYLLGSVAGALFDKYGLKASPQPTPFQRRQDVSAC